MATAQVKYTASVFLLTDMLLVARRRVNHQLHSRPRAISWQVFPKCAMEANFRTVSCCSVSMSPEALGKIIWLLSRQGSYKA